jgi:hypothetical protein
MVLLNFSDQNTQISLPFPKAGTWRETLDADVRPAALDLAVGADGEVQTVSVPSNYGMVFLRM